MAGKPGKILTICWECANAHALGCDWHRYFRPVDGWTAIYAPINVTLGYGAHIKHYSIESFTVQNCPEFEYGRAKRLADQTS